MSSQNSIFPGKRRKSYYRRILAFCAEQNIFVPTGFHTRDAYNYILIDCDCNPNKLIAVTWYLESWVIDYLNSNLAKGRNFKIYDFDKSWTLTYNGGKKLVRDQQFNCHKEADFLYEIKNED